jgi:hypothetical protein
MEIQTKAKPKAKAKAKAKTKQEQIERAVKQIKKLAGVLSDDDEMELTIEEKKQLDEAIKNIELLSALNALSDDEEAAPETKSKDFIESKDETPKKKTRIKKVEDTTLTETEKVKKPRKKKEIVIS